MGRDPDNSIALDDALASRHHAVIQKVKGELFIEDLHSTNGTLVNTSPVPPGKYVRLRQSDIILVGRTELSVQALAPGEPEEPPVLARRSSASLSQPPRSAAAS